MQKVKITQEELSRGDGQFDRYMQYVFQRLTAASCVPELALFQAASLIKKDGYVIKLGSDPDAVGLSVANWISNHFGERQEISYCLPQVAHQLYGITYLLRMPILRPDSILLTQAADGLSPSFEQRLPAKMLAQFEQDYNDLYGALELIVRLDATTVVHLESAAQRLYAGSVHHALSRWESLHFVERAMKEVLEPLGVKETGKNGHDVAGVLHDCWQAAGKKPLPRKLLDDVHCSADIRYQKSPAPFLQAMQAHHASIQLAALIAQEIPPVPPLESGMLIRFKDLVRDASLLLARIQPALQGEKSAVQWVKVVVGTPSPDDGSSLLPC
ncbi:hypothetical protein [Roseateles flavus]|uniref:Uncharacterized protein n=1 Tax=Roseateles flavus TaxID=3149041 RepID=A0ABV0GKL6_9BURK